MKDQRPQRPNYQRPKFVCITNGDPGSKLGDEKKAFLHSLRKETPEVNQERGEKLEKVNRKY